jgi:hypothetical protein
LFKSALIFALLSFPFVTATRAVADADKPIIKRMDEVFTVQPPLTYTPWRSTPAVAETTIRRQVFFDDMEGGTSGWGVINFRENNPDAWHVVTGTNSCTGSAWWCGQTGLLHGDGYGNNWIQELKTRPFSLTGTNNNNLTFKYRARIEYKYDWCWVLIKSAAAGARWDTLAGYSGDFGAACNSASISIPNSWTTAVQPITLQFLMGSDLTVSTADSVGPFFGWSLDDVKVTGQGNVTRFIDTMEIPESTVVKWTHQGPNPGPLWHLEEGPGTSIPADCFFLTSNVWVPFQGSGFGLVPDHADAMLTSPPMSLEGIFSPNATPPTGLLLQLDDWINLPPDINVYWSLWVSGSNDLTTWTPWRNPTKFIYNGNTAPQCVEGNTLNSTAFNPYGANSGIAPGTRYLRIGIRIRDEKSVGIPAQDGGLLFLGVRTEGFYVDNVGVYYSYTISGVEAVDGASPGSRAAIRRAYPNPFNPSTTLEFSVPERGPVAVRIFDLQGRQVASLVDDTMSAGVYRVRWNGQDADGRPQASGLYFAQIQSGGSRQAVRLTMLK